MQRAFKKIPWILLSLLLLLFSYACLGWHVVSIKLFQFAWARQLCYAAPEQTGAELMRSTSIFCSVVIEHNLLGIGLALIWVVVAAIAYMSPLTSFNRFISRWFQSDTVAFLCVFSLLGFAILVLLWFNIFLEIATILAAEALARIDVQTLGLTTFQAFWVLIAISLAGLGIGCSARLLLPV